ISKPGAEILLNEVQKSLGLVITDAHIARLVPKETTTRLMASSLAIGDRAMEHIGTCQNLKYLELDGTNVTDAGLLRISGLRKLENLRLDNDNITDEGLRALESCSALTKFDVRGTHVTERGIEALKAKLPKLWARWSAVESEDAREAVCELQRLGVGT